MASERRRLGVFSFAVAHRGGPTLRRWCRRAGDVPFHRRRSLARRAARVPPMSRRWPVIGLSWSDVANAGQTAFPYIHAAGAGVLSAFGAGALVAPVTALEQRGGLLPP